MVASWAWWSFSTSMPWRRARVSSSVAKVEREMGRPSKGPGLKPLADCGSFAGLRRLRLEVGGGYLEAVEEQAGAAGFELPVVDAGEELAEGILDGGSVAPWGSRTPPMTR
jgi:hypothetical protein